jgi:D-alanyl-lipoteichoic acid acyltransferase DltB (MBOAT superfamily)
MIQRIQSIYLLLALILVGLMAWLPLGEIVTGSNVFVFNIQGVINTANSGVLVNGWPLMMMLAIIIIVQIVAIFMYKKRVRQMRFAMFNIILLIGLLGVSWYFLSSSMKQIEGGVHVFKIAMIFPLIASILNYLAIRAIGRDEALVRSIDRIR